MEADDDEDDEGDEAEEVGEENDRPYNLRQRKTVQRYEAPPIGTRFGQLISLCSLSPARTNLSHVVCAII